MGFGKGFFSFLLILGDFYPGFPLKKEKEDKNFLKPSLSYAYGRENVL